MSLQFSKVPMCEECGENPAVAFCLLQKDNGSCHWEFCCHCTDERDLYPIDFESFFGPPASTVNWLAHMNEKVGGLMNWNDFMTMMERFRAATGS